MELVSRIAAAAFILAKTFVLEGAQGCRRGREEERKPCFQTRNLVGVVSVTSVGLLGVDPLGGDVPL